MQKHVCLFSRFFWMKLESCAAVWTAVFFYFPPVVCDGEEWEAAHRCCSTVAAGWCCHTGSHTKLPAPTSFPPFVISSVFPTLTRLLCPPFTSLPLFFTPLPLSVSSYKHTHTHFYLPRLSGYSRSSLTVTVKCNLWDKLHFLCLLSK